MAHEVMQQEQHHPMHGQLQAATRSSTHRRPQHTMSLPGHLARGSVPQEHAWVGDTCYKHALAPANRPPLKNNGVFYGFANILYFSAVSFQIMFLAQDQAPAPAASVTHPGRQQSEMGRSTHTGMRTLRLFPVP